MKASVIALNLALMPIVSPAWASDVSTSSEPWAVNLRQDVQETRASFGVRLSIVDPQEIQEYQVDSTAPQGTYANPVMLDVDWNAPWETAAADETGSDSGYKQLRALWEAEFLTGH